MSNRVREILNQITALETELRTVLAASEHEVLFRIKGRRVEFERSVVEGHRKLRQRLLQWLRQSSARAFVSVPFTYAMLVPLLLLDAFATVYQVICFRLYRVAPVKRSDYIAVDRHHLAYLNSVEKLNCVYCGYANGLLAYVTEIAARTEQYWCPIKHARQMLGSHARYARFLEYGQAADYHEHLQQFRKALEPGGAP